MKKLPKEGDIIVITNNSGMYNVKQGGKYTVRSASGAGTISVISDSGRGQIICVRDGWRWPAPKAPRHGTQQAVIMDHLKRRDYITDVEASGLYGIGQCAGVVWKLRKLGHQITTTMQEGVRARYAEYRLVRPS